MHDVILFEINENRNKRNGGALGVSLL